jgi:CheY-like chemotaxis protein/signal transduction histidine kinase/HPt (histidine-containing phosphotransfer) domain-containing protein
MNLFTLKKHIVNTLWLTFFILTCLLVFNLYAVYERQSDVVLLICVDITALGLLIAIWYWKIAPLEKTFQESLTKQTAAPTLEEVNPTEETDDFKDILTVENSQFTQTLETVCRSKSELLADMILEIRMSMNGIIGMTELTLNTELTEKQYNYLKTVKRSAYALLAFVDDVLECLKSEPLKLELAVDPIDFNIRDSINDTIEVLSLQAHNRGVELAFNIDYDVPSRVLGDPSRLRQIIVNFLGNAIRFTESGKVTLTVDVEQMLEDKISLHFAISMFDSGFGTDKNFLIVEAFNLDKGLKTKEYSEIGLRLATAKQLVEMMGGQTWVESASNLESIFHFTIYFELQTEHEPAPIHPLPHLFQLEGIHVLVVEHNETNRHIFKEALSSYNMKPKVVGSGNTALIAIEQAKEAGEPFRLILIDAKLPEMNGFELASRIKESPHSKNTKIIILTPSGRHGDALRCRQLGISAYLTKPVKKSDLISAIATVMKSDVNDEDFLVTRHFLRESRRGLHVLLADPDYSNQQMIIELLKKWGLNVEAVGSWQDAVEALSRQWFDIILLDAQMPDMDHANAMKIIQEKEKELGGHISMIALTNPPQNDARANSIDGKVDTFLPKPINADLLMQTIDGLISVTFDRDLAPDQLPVEPNKIFDRQTALALVDGDNDLLNIIVDLFLTDTPEQINYASQGIQQNNYEMIELHAHSIKGAAYNIGAHSVKEIAFQLEVVAKKQDIELAKELLASLKEEFNKVIPFLYELKNSYKGHSEEEVLL